MKKACLEWQETVNPRLIPEEFPMTSPKTRVLYQDDLFPMSLSNLCASNHLLMLVAGTIQWVLFDGSYCVDKGHPVLPTQINLPAL